ncbi:MAG: RHS repeat-associated core domain-containing protein, partial [Methylocella sp.]
MRPLPWTCRFPGQWFQLETGLHYHWHRHYDATIGRYLQPDPPIVDDGTASVRGLSTDLTGTTSSVSNGELIADALGRVQTDAFSPKVCDRALMPGGPSVHGDARGPILTGARAVALAKAKTGKEAHGPSSRARAPAIAAPGTPSTPAPGKESAASAGRPSSTPLRRWHSRNRSLSLGAA